MTDFGQPLGIWRCNTPNLHVFGLSGESAAWNGNNIQTAHRKSFEPKGPCCFDAVSVLPHEDEVVLQIIQSANNVRRIAPAWYFCVFSLHPLLSSVTKSVSNCQGSVYLKWPPHNQRDSGSTVASGPAGWRQRARVPRAQLRGYLVWKIILTAGYSNSLSCVRVCTVRTSLTYANTTTAWPVAWRPLSMPSCVIRPLPTDTHWTKPFRPVWTTPGTPSSRRLAW